MNSPESNASSVSARPGDGGPDRSPHPVPAASAGVDANIYGSILGIFLLLGAAVVLFSWKGYRIAAQTREAERAMTEHRWDDAIAPLEAITDTYPDAWVRQRQLGDCLLALKEPMQALKAYETSIRVNPEQDLRAKVGRALYLMDPSDKRAASFLQEGLAARPTDPEANFYVALLEEDREEYKNAARHFLAATEEPEWFEQSKPHIEFIRKQILGH